MQQPTHEEQLKRPLITSKTIKDKSDLMCFVQSVSHATFLSTYRNMKPDYGFIERLIQTDLMDVDATLLPATVGVSKGAGAVSGGGSSSPKSLLQFAPATMIRSGSRTTNSNSSTPGQMGARSRQVSGSLDGGGGSGGGGRETM
jgi:hypothetical protein